MSLTRVSLTFDLSLYLPLSKVREGGREGAKDGGGKGRNLHLRIVC